VLLVGRRKACVLVAEEDRRRPKQRRGLDDDGDMVVVGVGRFAWLAAAGGICCE